MKAVFFIVLLLTTFATHAENGSEDHAKKCLKFVQTAENYKTAHKNHDCLNAANAGNGPAQYSVGMGYGFEGYSEAGEEYYLKAAQQGVIAAYLALGNFYRDTASDKAIYWYKRFVNTKECGYHYVAAVLADIYKKKDDDEQFEHWRRISSEKSNGDQDTCDANPVIHFKPLCPEDALEQCIEGRVTLKFIVKRDLRNEYVEVIESDPKGVFDAAAISNLKKMISTYIRDGKTGEETTETFRFEIEDDC